MGEGQQTMNGTDDSAKRESKPTRYIILYRIEGDEDGQFRTALDVKAEPDKDTNTLPRLIVEAHGQPDARAEFLDVAVDEPDLYGKVIQVAAVPASSWDPKTPRQKVLTAWE